MWATLDLLVRREARGRDLSENVEEWLEGVNRKIVAASADGEEEGGVKKVRRRKGRSKGKVAGGEEGPEERDPSTAVHEEVPPDPRAEEEGAKEEKVGSAEEEKGSRNGMRTWNPRKGKRGHDREIGRRVEKLMGTSVVKFTDRKYMMQLQERILESHYESTEKRMNNRMNEEVEREKRLILENKLPINEVSGLSNHPVFVVRNRLATNPRVIVLNASSKKRYARMQDMEAAIRGQEEQEKKMDSGSRVKKKKKPNKMMEEKEASLSSSLLSEAVGEKASMKVLLDFSEFEGETGGEEEEDMEAAVGRTRRLQRTFAEDGEGPKSAPSGARKLKMKRRPSPLLEEEIDWEEEGDSEEVIEIHETLSKHLGFSPSLGSEEGSEDICNISPGKEIEKVKYEAPLVKELRRAETVEQLYELAEQIVGPVPPCISNK